MYNSTDAYDYPYISMYNDKMSSGKRENGWFKYPSKSCPGKFYYFNPSTGEAVWNLNDPERMYSRPNFTHYNKWQNSPELDSPSVDNPWIYQPKYRKCHQNTPIFGQVSYPRNTMESYPVNMSRQTSAPVFMKPAKLINMPSFDRQSPTWLGFRSNIQPQPFMQERNLFSNNPYMQRAPTFNEGFNSQVFAGPSISPPNQNKGFTRKRTISEHDAGYYKEPLTMKRMRSQTDLRNENIFGSSLNAFSQPRSSDSLIPESYFQAKINNPKVCDCKCTCSKFHQKLPSQSKSHENLSNIREPNPFLLTKQKDNTFKSAALSRPRSMDSLTEAGMSEISSNFSLKHSFVFPLKKSESKTFKTLSKTEFSPEKKIQNATVTQSDLDCKKQSASSDGRNALVTSRVVRIDEGKKIKTSYSDQNKLKDPSKKRVTFDLPVVAATDDNSADIPNTKEGLESDPREPVEEAQIYYLVPDIEVLLTEFQLLEQFVKFEERSIIVIADATRRKIESLCSSSEGVSRRRVMAARHLTRAVREKPPHILIEPADPAAEKNGDDDEITLMCCLQVMEDGRCPVIITNNEDLYNRAIPYAVEGYTTEEIRNYMKQDKSQLFESTEDTTKHVSRIEKHAPEPHADENDNNYAMKNVTTTNQNHFFDKENDLSEVTIQIRNEIRNLNLHDKFDVRNNRDALAAKNQQKPEKETWDLFKNGHEPMEENFAARKKETNINVYNVHSLLKHFSIKTRDMMERVMTKMDEYFCIFSQIMEDIFLDIFNGYPSFEDLSKSPLQDLVQRAREIFGDNRTAAILLDKMAAALDDGILLRNGRMELILTPNAFIKLFGCGTLLVKVLKSILLDNITLQEGESLLEALERNIEDWGAEPELPSAPSTVLSDQRGEFVKNPSDVLDFLARHYPDWKGYIDNKNNNNYKSNDNDSNHNDTVNIKPKTHIIRTDGRNIGLLKLGPGKPIVLRSKENTTEKPLIENGSKNKVEKEDGEKQNTKETNKAKLLRKLAVESLNLPPKMKEIDVERREKIDKQLTGMLDEILSSAPAPLTKFYNLKNIIVNVDDSDKAREVTDTKPYKRIEIKSKLNSENDSNSIIFDSNHRTNEVTKNIADKSNDLRSKLNKKKDSKSIIMNNNDEITKATKPKAGPSVYFKSVILDNDKTTKVNKTNINTNSLKCKLNSKKDSNGIMKIDSTTENVEPRDLNEENNNKTDNVQNAANNKTKYSLDLDALDYSDIEESVEIKSESDSSNNELVIDEENCAVTTTQMTSNDSSPTDENINVMIDDDNEDDDYIDINNYNNDPIFNEDGNDRFEKQAYCLAQVFLIKLSNTLLSIKDFLESSIIELRKENPETKNLIYEKATLILEILLRIKENLNNIIERESNPNTAVAPILKRTAPDDKRMAYYRRVVYKCLEQSAVLASCCELVRRAAGTPYPTPHTPHATHN